MQKQGNICKEMWRKGKSITLKKHLGDVDIRPRNKYFDVNSRRKNVMETASIY